MSNAGAAVVPEIVIDLDGEPVTLRYSCRVLCAIERDAGVNVTDPRLWIKPDLNFITAVIWGGVRASKPGIKLDAFREAHGMQIVSLWPAIAQVVLESITPPQVPGDQKKIETQPETPVTEAPQPVS